MKLLDELKLLVMSQGIPAEVVERAVSLGEDLAELLATGISRNVAQAAASYTQVAAMLGGLAEKAKAAGETERAEDLGLLAAQALANVKDLLTPQGDGEPEKTQEPAQA